MLQNTDTILANLKNDGVKAQMCVTSPPYFGLRDYGVGGQIGLEQTPEEYIANMVAVFRAVRDVLADDGTLWLNIGDSYGKGKQLLGIPWRLAFALQADGWVLRQDIIWSKPNPMPEPSHGRCVKAHEYVFLFAKSARYYFDNNALREPAVQGVKSGQSTFNSVTADGDMKTQTTTIRHGRGKSTLRSSPDGMRNRRSVWTVTTRPYKGAHFATFPPALIEPCILAGSRPGDVVLDPFMGSGTTAQVALQHGRQYLGCELNQDYKALQDERIAKAIQQSCAMKDAQLALA